MNDRLATSAIEKRYVELLGQLRLLMEGGTLSIAPRTSHGKQESRPPAGTQLDRSAGALLDPDRDPLILCFLQRWDLACDDRDRVGTLAEYEIRVEKRRRPHDGRVAGGTLDGEKVELANDDVLARDERIVTRYEGWHPVEVAAVETEGWGWCSEAAVRVVRRKARRDEETGRLQEGATDDRSYALELKGEGFTLREISERVGRPRSTVQSWVEKSRAA